MESPRGVNDPSLRAAAACLPDADLVLLLGKKLDKCHEAAVPCLVAPALAHASPQAMLEVNVFKDGPRQLAGQLGEENSRLELEMRIRPKHRRSRHAVLPDPSGSAVAEHRGAALPRRPPRYFPAQRYLGLRDVKPELLGELFLQTGLLKDGVGGMA